MKDIHALSGAYAVDALDDLERARFERHLAECADCRAEVAGLREAAALLPELHAAPPPPALRDALLAEIRTVRPLPPAGRTLPLPPRRWPSRLVAAAAVVLVVGLGSVVLHPWSDEGPSTADRVLQASDAVRREVTLPQGGTVTVVNSARLGRAVLVAEDLKDPPEGKVYELWLQGADDQVRPAGLVESGGDKAVVLTGDSSDAKWAGITIEPEGGSAKPTSDPIAQFSFGAV